MKTKPEPLKGKIEHTALLPNKSMHWDEDIRSAVEWLKQKIERENVDTINGIMNKIDKAFEDVMRE